LGQDLPKNHAHRPIISVAALAGGAGAAFNKIQSRHHSFPTNRQIMPVAPASPGLRDFAAVCLRASMTLRRKTFFILLSTSVASFVVSYAAARTILSRGLTGIEDNFARNNLQQARAAFENTVDDIDLVAADWAAWDDSYEFVRDLNPAYIKSSLPVQSLANVGINAIAYFDATGKLVFSRQIDLAGEKEVRFSESLSRHLQPGSRLLNQPSLDSSVKGLLMLPEGPMLIAARPILKSDKTGPSRGTLVMARYLDANRMAALRRILLRDPSLRNVSSPDLPVASRAALGELLSGSSVVIQRPDDQFLACFDLIRDLYGRPALLLQIDLPRDVFLQGRIMIRTLLISLLGAAVVTSIIVLRLLSTSILSRVGRLNAAARDITVTQDAARRVPVGGQQDELANLAISINEMLAGLEASERQMRAAKEAAEAAARMKSRFVANVSHEIRTPLNCIIGFAETILSGPCSPNVQHQAGTILQESEVLLALINDLLDEAKIEAGKMKLEQRPFELAALLDHILEVARGQARSKDLAVTLQISPNMPPTLLGDSLRLRQVLTNLVGNAIKFTERGSVTLQVQREESASGDQLRFSVVDTGIGISSERQKAIFESFVQADAATTREYGGTGLGTTIARQLVEMMGGQMGLESQLGQGSTFWFVIPCVLPSDQPVTANGKGTNAQNLCILPRGRILLVEDYPANREVARLHLERAGHAVTTVSNGQEALSAWETFPFDLILMDVQMPGIDGAEVTRRIRSSALPSAKVPIIGLTADAEGATRSLCLAAGMDDLIFKPVRRKTLISTVHRWLSMDHSEPNASPTEASMPVVANSVLPLDYAQATPEFGDIQTLECIAEGFLANLAADLPRMRDALAQGNIATLRARCHAIKGGAATLMASPVAERARTLEELSETDTERLAAGLAELAEEYERLKEYIHAHAQVLEETTRA
jgi:signal transduction histidine kinase/DNA-binding NarL/FixJ family response regulator